MAETAPVDYGAEVTSVQPTTKERVLTGIAHAVGGATGVSSGGVDAAIEKHQQARLNEARMHRTNASTYAGILATGKSPQTGEPLSPQEQQQYQDWYNASMAAYEKAAGVNKETKGAITRAKAIAEHVIGLGRKQREGQGGQGAGGTGAQPAGLPPPPRRSGGVFGDQSGSDMLLPGDINPRTGQPIPVPADLSTDVSYRSVGAQPRAGDASVDASPGAAGAGAGGGLPPPPGYTPQVAMSGGALAQQVADRRALDYETKLQRIKTQGEIERDAAKTKAKSPRLQAAQFEDADGNTISGSYDPSNGEYLDQNGNVVPNAKRVTVAGSKPQPVTLAGPDGKPHPGYKIPGKGLFDVNMNPLPPDTPVFSAWMAPQMTDTWRQVAVQQPDGSIQLVWEETKGTRTRGQPAEGGITPPPGGAKKTAGTGGAAKPTGGAAKPSQKPGRTVGGKVPPGVQKAYDSYNGAITRLRVMQDALPRALKGDQQAMINLLYNHIGMTTGLQKGGRITRDIISEAENSAPATATILKRIGIDKEFEITPELLRGVVLDSQTMHNMIGLAEDRVKQEHDAWQREIQSAKQGYGMSGDVPPPPSSKFPSPPSGGGGPAPKTWNELKKQAASQAASSP